MKLELPDIPAEERTPLVEALLALIHVQQDRIQQLEATVQQLRDEIALLKGQKPRPDIKPSLLEARPPKTAALEGSKRPGSAKRPKTAELTIHREVPLHPEGLPVGATFRGYEAYVVQELLIHNENTRYLRARYDLPGGGSVLAPFPAGVCCRSRAAISGRTWSPPSWTSTIKPRSRSPYCWRNCGSTASTSRPANSTAS